MKNKKNYSFIDNISSMWDEFCFFIENYEILIIKLFILFLVCIILLSYPVFLIMVSPIYTSWYKRCYKLKKRQELEDYKLDVKFSGKFMADYKRTKSYKLKRFEEEEPYI